MNKQAVIDRVEAEDIRFIRLWFTDILGFQKSFAITREELEKALDEGMGFDGSSIQGFARIEESDMVAMPDPTTFQLLDWRPAGQNMASICCDILEPDGSPHPGDPRWVLKRNLKRAADMGYTYYVGPELEFFLFEGPHEPKVLDNGGYFDRTPMRIGEIRKEMVLALEAHGIKVEYSHHEVAPSQHEVDMRYAEGLKMADMVMTFRTIVKEVADKHGIHATFMPKPLDAVNGSGMHVHQSLFEEDANAFFDAEDGYHLSDIGKSYIAGILKHAREITLVCNQWVNSYKRLVPGYEAPVYVTWAQQSRADLVRIPQYQPGHEQSTRLELRSPDPACNPYLAFSVMLAAGLKGIEEGYEPPAPAAGNTYELSEQQRRELGIEVLPEDLWDAIQVTEQSELVRECLGDHVFFKFIENKKMEWDQYRALVTPWEIERYLPLL